MLSGEFPRVTHTPVVVLSEKCHKERCIHTAECSKTFDTNRLEP